MNFNIRIIIYSFIVLTACSSDDDIVQYFEYPDHNVLNIGSQLTDLYITNDSNTLIAADKGNNRVIFIDVSTDDMAIKKTVWVGSEPTSLDMTNDGRYLLVGLLGGSSVSIINMGTMTLEGRLNLKMDSVFDIEYLSNKCQLIVSFVSTDPHSNYTYLHTWWADQDGEWYGSNTSCSYAEDASVLTVSDFNTDTSPSDHTKDAYGQGYKRVSLSGGTGTGAIAKVVVHEDQYIESVEIVYGGEGYTRGDILTIPGYDIGGSDGQCIITGTFNNPNMQISESSLKEVEPPQLYKIIDYDEPEIEYESSSHDFTSKIDFAGLMSVSDDESRFYLLDKTRGTKQILGYQTSEYGLTNQVGSETVVEEFFFFHDLEYVNGFGVLMAINGTDPVDGLTLDHVSVYDSDNLYHAGNLSVGSVPLAIAYDAVGNHIYISPTDVDDNGMFIIEFSIDTQLQTNYYQVAGLLGSHALLVDPKGEYIYAAVDDLSDQDTHEPYSGSSFNIQKIKIIPEGTYPINDF